MTTACANCPFRVNSPYGYDADALECLDEGYEPSCHNHAGFDGIFHVDWPTGVQACHGHAAWQNDEPGFQRPVLTNQPIKVAS